MWRLVGHCRVGCLSSSVADFVFTLPEHPVICSVVSNIFRLHSVIFERRTAALRWVDIKGARAEVQKQQRFRQHHDRTS